MLRLGGQRWSVVYQLFGTEARVREAAEEICIEQTVEFPVGLLPDGPIREQILGRLEGLQRVAADRFEATVSYAIETVGTELPQLLNVIMGNTSLKRGVRVMRLELPPVLLEAFSGPRFGNGADDRFGSGRILGVREIGIELLQRLGAAGRDGGFLTGAPGPVAETDQL